MVTNNVRIVFGIELAGASVRDGIEPPHEPPNRLSMALQLCFQTINNLPIHLTAKPNMYIRYLVDAKRRRRSILKRKLKR
jgi:hypothetical protein